MRARVGKAFKGTLVTVGLSLSLTNLTTAQEQQPRTTWNVGLGIQEANQYDRLFNDVFQQDQILDNANATFGFSTRTPRARVGLFGRVGADFYRKGSYSDRVNYGGGFSWDFAPSERLRSILSQNVNRGFMIQTLSELGVLAPNVDTLAANTSWSLDYRTSPRTMVSTTLAYSFAEFESDQAIPGSQIVLNQQPLTGPFRSFGLERAGTDNELQVPDAQDAVLQILATEGIGVSKTTSHWATAIFGLRHRLTEYSMIGLDLGGGYRTIHTATEEPRDGAEGAFRVWAAKDIGSSTQASANYTFRRSLALRPNTTIHSLIGGFGHHTEGGRIDFDFRGGASYYQAETMKDSLTPTADARFTASLSRSTRFSSSYQRLFSQSLGFGRTLLIDLVNLSLEQEIGSRLTATALGGGSFATDPLVDGSRFDAVRAGGMVQYRILGGLSAGTSWFALRTEQGEGRGLDKTDQKLWSIFLNFNTSWH